MSIHIPRKFDDDDNDNPLYLKQRAFTTIASDYPSCLKFFFRTFYKI